jgi:hypothetical protein
MTIHVADWDELMRIVKITAFDHIPPPPNVNVYSDSWVPKCSNCSTIIPVDCICVYGAIGTVWMWQCRDCAYDKYAGMRELFDRFPCYHRAKCKALHITRDLRNG